MSTNLFSYDFFYDGRSDAFSEVRILQRNGLWTPEKRASWTKEAVAANLRLKHAHPSISEGAGYYAGRVSALKSRRTAHFSQASALLACPLSPDTGFSCSVCRDKATWDVGFSEDPEPLTTLCDLCRQEWTRGQTVYTHASGWDWDDHEEPLPPLSTAHDLGKKLVVRKPMEASSIFFPSAVVIGLGLLDLALGVPLSIYIITCLIILPMTIKESESILRWLFEHFVENEP